MTGVVNVNEADCSKEPPDEAVYQSIVSPIPGVAEIVTIPEPQRDAPVPPGVITIALMIAFTEVLPEDTQPVVVFLASA